MLLYQNASAHSVIYKTCTRVIHSFFSEQIHTHNSVRETTNLCDTCHTCQAIHDLSAQKLSTFSWRVSSDHFKLSFFLDFMAPKMAGRMTWGKSGNWTRGTGAFQTQTQASNNEGSRGNKKETLSAVDPGHAFTKFHLRPNLDATGCP